MPFPTRPALPRAALASVLLVSCAAVASTTFAACGTEGPPPASSAPQGNGLEEAGTSSPGFGDAATGTSDASGSCVAPDMLIALDRTQTMIFTVDGKNPPNTPDGHATSKWSLAIEGIEQLTAAPLDQGMRFGLELWPKAGPGCVTLAERIGKKNATNAKCEEGEIVVGTELGAGAQIAAALDPETTVVCNTTPTGTALAGARTYLEGRKAPGKKQFVVLITDGADWEVTCPEPNPLEMVDELTKAGIGTVVVGFSAEASLQYGVGAAFLNDMACAGGTAKGFPNTCSKNDQGSYRAKNPEAGASEPLFYVASSPTELSTSLRALAQTICCDCVK